MARDNRKLFHKKLHNDADGIRRVINERTGFDTLETYKAIRTNIMFSMPKTDAGKVIAVTSSVPGEGKTSVSINIAITFAQMGAKVILLDCDLRKPRVHRYLQIDRSSGVTNVLCGFISLPNAICHGVRENLDIIPAGEATTNPAELLGSEEFGRMLAQLQREYEYIFVDTPPINVVTDSAIVLQACTGAVLVSRVGFSTFPEMDGMVEAVKRANPNILGFIVLGSKEKGKKYGYSKGSYSHYSSGYGYGYGYGYSYSDKDDEDEKTSKKGEAKNKKRAKKESAALKEGTSNS